MCGIAHHTSPTAVSPSDRLCVCVVRRQDGETGGAALSAAERRWLWTAFRQSDGTCPTSTRCFRPTLRPAPVPGHPPSPHPFILHPPPCLPASIPPPPLHVPMTLPLYLSLPLPLPLLVPMSRMIFLCCFCFCFREVP